MIASEIVCNIHKLGDTRSTLNGLICLAMLDIICNVFPFPFRFFAKAKLQLQCFVVQVHLQKVIETHIF